MGADDQIPRIAGLRIGSDEHEQCERTLIHLEVVRKLPEVGYQSVLIHVSTPFLLSRIALRVSSASWRVTVPGASYLLSGFQRAAVDQLSKSGFLVGSTAFRSPARTSN